MVVSHTQTHITILRPSWVNGIRYLGIFIVCCTKFQCSVNDTKCSFYQAAIGIFGKIGHLPSEEVIVQLLLQKCMPILLHGFEVCAIDKRSLQSLDFTVNHFLWNCWKRLISESCMTANHYLVLICLVLQEPDVLLNFVGLKIWEYVSLIFYCTHVVIIHHYLDSFALIFLSLIILS